jgi:hypothetical protein
MAPGKYVAILHSLRSESMSQQLVDTTAIAGQPLKRMTHEDAVRVSQAERNESLIAEEINQVNLLTPDTDCQARHNEFVKRLSDVQSIGDVD